MEEGPVTVVILAAGLGTRMKSKKAKVLHCAGGMPLVRHVVRTAMKITSPDRIFVVVGYQADQVEAELQDLGVQFIRQLEQKGTGHALLCCRDQLHREGGRLLVLYGDTPLLSERTLRDLLSHQRDNYTAATLITTVLEDPTGYGRVLLDTEGNVTAIVEEKACTEEQRAKNEVNSGIYCFRSDLLWRHIDEIQANNPAKEYYLTDIVEIFGHHGYAVGAMRLDDSTEVLGINTRVELAEADRILRMRKARELMLAGVTIHRPETVMIDEDVQMGMDCVVEPFAQILGKTVIGDDCHIGAGSIIMDSELGNQVEIGPFTIIGQSKLEDNTQAGPFARLRPNCVMEAGSRVGNFVELKNTRLGRGSKANHLAYLGDSEIGPESNIGAGTITCNYDGSRKHKTRIGAGAFVGSNVTIVAPVEIGAGSYIGAGSVITESVPPHALALGRSRQVIKEGWTLRRREQE